uniref:Uncharacterized protein n=1 Tax=Hyaloperonospora arabidopsidis (strain Emoy2) TaxID=559515 RepID=M4BXL9_HYAAE
MDFHNVVYECAMRCVNVSRTSCCFVWKMPPSERCIKHVRFGFISHFKMEKSDSADDMFPNAVARSPQNARKQSNRPLCEMPHASSKNVFTSCLSMTARNSSSSSYVLRSSLWSDSTSSIHSSVHVFASCSRCGARTSLTNNRGDRLTSCAGRTGGASCTRGRLLVCALLTRSAGRAPGSSRRWRPRVRRLASRRRSAPPIAALATSPGPRCERQCTHRRSACHH